MDAEPYYAKNGTVWKRPERRVRADGTTSITLGFPVCRMSEAVGDDAAEIVAQLMNRGNAQKDLEIQRGRLPLSPRLPQPRHRREGGAP